MYNSISISRHKNFYNLFVYLLYILICSKKISDKLKIAFISLSNRSCSQNYDTERLRKIMRLDNIHWRHSIIADSGYSVRKQLSRVWLPRNGGINRRAR